LPSRLNKKKKKKTQKTILQENASASEKSGINERRCLNIQKKWHERPRRNSSSKLATQQIQARAKTRSGRGEEGRGTRKDVRMLMCKENKSSERGRRSWRPALSIVRRRTPTRLAARR
jgi:hypothetical protein